MVKVVLDFAGTERTFDKGAVLAIRDGALHVLDGPASLGSTLSIAVFAPGAWKWASVEAETPH